MRNLILYTLGLMLFTTACKTTKQSLKVASKVVADSTNTKTANTTTKTETVFYGDTLSGTSIVADTNSIFIAESKGLKLSFTLQPKTKRISYIAIAKPISTTNSHVGVNLTERIQAKKSTVLKTDSETKTSWLSPVWLLNYAFWIIALIVCYLFYKRYFN